MTFKLDGLKELEAALTELKTRATARRTADRALRKAAEPIRDKARELAPDDLETGVNNYLKASIKIGRAGTQERQRGNSGNLVTTYIGIDGSTLPPKVAKTKTGKGGKAILAGGGVAAYSIFVEMGTNSRPAQPYMRPAWEQTKDAALARLADDLRTEITKTAERAARKRAKA